MATFRKRDGRWQAQICKAGVRKAKTFRTKTEAIEWAREVEDTLTDAGSVQAALERYMTEVCPSHKGERWERIRLTRISKELPSKRLSELEPNDLAKWRDKRLKTVKGASVRREMNLLNQVFVIAINEWGWLKTNPLKTVKKPPNSQPRRRGVSQEEIKAITEELGYMEGYKAQTKKQEVAVLFLLGIETAMRLGEMLSLTRENIELKRKVAILVDTKNGDRREIPLSSKAVELIKQLSGERGRIASVGGSASTIFRKAKIQAGFPDVHFHDSRSEGLTRLSKKLSVIQLAKVVGHRDPRSLMIYYSETAEEIAKLL